MSTNPPKYTVRKTGDIIYINDRAYDRKLIEKIISAASSLGIRHIVIDCFAGLGGVTAGFGEYLCSTDI